MKLLPTRLRKLLAVGAAGSLMFMAPMPASAEVATSPSGPCGAMAAAVVEESGVAPADVSYDFVCTEAIVTVEITSPDGTVSSLTEETADVASTLPPSSLAEARAVTCTIIDVPTRTIVSELQVNIDACVLYGQENDPQNGSWLRSTKVEWTAYPGYPSVQNQLRLISTEASTGDVWLFGTLTLQKQNGVGIPIDRTSATFDIRSGNPPIPSAYLTGADTWGSHAVRMDDLSITDFDYQFSAQIADPTLFTPRFHCDTNVERCYYPNGEEAGL